MELVRNIRARVRNALCRLKWELGQTTAEYALVLLAAAVIAVILIKWAKQTDTLNQFFDDVVTKITGMASNADG